MATTKLNVDDRDPSTISVLFNDDAWCCIIECCCPLKRRPHIRRRYGRRIIRRLPPIPVRKLPVPPPERKIRKLPVPPQPRGLPTPPPRRLPTPPRRPLPLVSFPAVMTPSTAFACGTPMLMESMISCAGHTDETLLSPLIDWDVVMDEIIYRNSNASSKTEVVLRGNSWRASFTRTTM